MATKQKIVHHWQLEIFKLSREEAQKFFHRILGKLVTMGNRPEVWLLKKTASE